MALFTDPHWQAVLGYRDPRANPEVGVGEPLRDLIATAVVSDWDDDNVGVLTGILKGPSPVYIGCVATADGVRTCSISPVKEAAESDIQRKRLAPRVGLVQRTDMKPKPVR